MILYYELLLTSILCLKSLLSLSLIKIKVMNKKNTMMMMMDVNHHRIRTNGIWMHVVEKGRGPLVLLLHGFPEIWYSWRHQINFLSDHGYRVLAPDLRGFGDTDSPITPSSYTAFHIVGDLIGLLDHFHEQQVPLFLLFNVLYFVWFSGKDFDTKRH